MEEEQNIIFKDFRTTDQQKEIIKALTEQSFSTKNLAKMYIGALKVLQDESNPEHIHQSAHSLRELGGYITSHLKEATGTEKAHKELMKQLMTQLDELGGVVTEVIVKQWYDLHQYLVILCHHGSEVQVEDFEFNLLKFENILYSLLCPVYGPIEELDKLIKIENPTKQDMELVNSLIKKQSHYRYFFKNLYHPNWVDLLIENGFFDKPPKKGEYSIEPSYLKKIVYEKHKEVIEIIQKLSSTTHEGAQVEFMKALNIAPTRETFHLKKTIKRWIANARSGYFTLSKQVIQYICNLFEGNEVEVAYEMTQAMLAITNIKRFENDEMRISYDIEGYFYGEILRDLLPELQKHEPLRALRLLAKLLVIDIIKHIESSGKVVEGDYDLSLKWRRLIEEHDYYTHDKDIKNFLVSTIRDLLMYIGDEQKDLYNEAIEILREKNYLIFRRLEFFIIRIFPDISKNYISEAISNKLYFQYNLRILEVYQLLKDCFPLTKEVIQEEYLKWIVEGPDIENYKQIFENNRGTSASDEIIESHIHNWRLKKIAPIKQYISRKLIQKYNIKEERLKHINPFEDLPRVQFGPVSPIKKEQMENMSVQEIFNYIKEYNEPEHSLSVSKVGLGRALRDSVEKRPNKFTVIVPEFLKFTETHKYISFLLDGFESALKNKHLFDWDSIISLCKAIMIKTEKSIEISKESIFYKERTLRDIKTSIGRLFRIGLSKDLQNSIPFSYKNDVFVILNVLCDDEEPTFEEELNNIKGNWRISDMSINSVRGIAMNRLIDFTFWNAGYSYDETLLKDNSISKIPEEIKTVIEYHLDDEADPSYTIKYIYGFHLNNLIYLDKKWVIENLTNIFPEEKSKQRYWEAAWSGYLDGNFAHTLTFGILREQYVRAIECFNDGNLEIKLFNFSTEKFANEIMRLYINGIEDLNSEHSLVFKFFQKTPDDVRKLGIAYLGQIISNLEDLEEYDKVLKRLMELWEDRLRVMKNSNIGNFKRELVFFFFWFKNSIFEKGWTINRLEEVLDLTDGSINVFSDVLDALLEYIDEFPLNVINCLEKIIKNQVRTDGYLLFERKYKPILARLLLSNEKDVREKTKSLINYLGSRDLHYFRDLLD